MATYRIKGKRHLKKYTADRLTPVYMANIDAQTLVDGMCGLSWDPVPDRDAQIAYHTDEVVDTDTNMTGLDMNVAIRDRLDAAMFCAGHKGGVHRVYANAACYVFELPYMDAYPNITKLTAKVTSDPYNSGGVRLAVHVSDTPDIPVRCPIAREGVAHAAGQVPRESRTGADGETYWYAATGDVTLDIPEGTAMKKYLFLVIALEEYTVRGDWFEGSAFIAPVVTIETSGEITGWGDGIEDTMAGSEPVVAPTAVVIADLTRGPVSGDTFHPDMCANLAMCTLSCVPCELAPGIGIVHSGKSGIDQGERGLFCKSGASMANVNKDAIAACLESQLSVPGSTMDVVELRRVFSELPDTTDTSQIPASDTSGSVKYIYDGLCMARMFSEADVTADSFLRPGVGVSLQGVLGTWVPRRTVNGTSVTYAPVLNTVNKAVLVRRRWLQTFRLPHGMTNPTINVSWTSIPSMNHGSMIYNAWCRQGMHLSYSKEAIGDIGLYVDGETSRIGNWVRLFFFSAPDVGPGTAETTYTKSLMIEHPLPSGIYTLLLTAHLKPGDVNGSDGYFWSGHSGLPTVSAAQLEKRLQFTGRSGWCPKIILTGQ